jgi:phosphatidylglycerol lysyltransferase
MGTAVCLGDPVGPEEDVEAILRSFIRYCMDNGWALALLMPELIPLYKTLGFTVMKIGEGAVVDLKHFCEKTANKKYFRYVRRKLESEGYVLKRYIPPYEADLIDVVEAVSREWLDLPGHREFGFIQGSFERNYVAKTTLYILRDGTGKAIAFANEVPSYRKGDATVDMMRHRKKIHWGAMDYLFQGLMRMLWEEGKCTFYLGMAGVVEKPEKGFADKAFFQLTKHLDWIVHSRGVRQFKEKFDPVWEDRYLVFYGNPLFLAKIALAVMRVL